jgi:Tol biopolymer transport system component
VRRLLALTCLAVLACATAAAAATPKPKNGFIAFSAKKGNSRVIYTRNSNGTGLRVVPTQGKADKPSVSGGGLRMAFTRYGAGGAQIWVEYLNGTMLRQLTSGPLDSMPDWSVGGDQLVFVRGRSGARDLYTIGADGSSLTRLTRSSADDHSPDWAANGRIAFVRRHARKNDDIYVITQGSSVSRRLTASPDPDLAPTWSPTGRTLIYAHGKSGHRDLYVLTSDGKHRRRLTATPGDENDPSFSPDGSRVAFTYTRKGKRYLYFMKVKGGAIKSLPSNRNVRARRLTRSTSASSLPSWQPTGLPPQIAAAGDVACRPDSPSFNNGQGTGGACRQMDSSNLMLRGDFTNVLAIGDLQYENGEYANFLASFDPSWGRLKPIIKPVPGNHEYQTPNASGYFDYFNGPGNPTGQAGDRDKGYYSFDIGTWHVLALNSECDNIGGCDADSPQIRFVRADMAAHPARCTLAYFHRPHFSSGEFTDNGDMRAAWDALYAGGADLILSAHDHIYERFAPQTPDGVADPAGGIRQITIGEGGRSHHDVVNPQPNSEFRDATTFGIGELTLNDGSYDWRFVAVGSGATADRGSANCH